MYIRFDGVDVKDKATLFSQVKQAEIIYAIIGDIMRGELAVEHKLPSQKELCQRFNTTPVTISRAIQQMIRIGLVDSVERQGVFIRPQNTEFPTFGLVFPTNPANSSRWNLFFGAQRYSATHLSESLPHPFKLYYDIEGRTDIGDYQNLIEDIATHKIFGLVFATSPWTLATTPLIQDPVLPRVAFMPEHQFPHIDAISNDGRSFLGKALDQFQQEGRKRIAIIASGELGEQYLNNFRASVQARGMHSEPYWIHAPSITHPHAATSIAHLLFHSQRKDEHPDGLIIADDNFIEATERGILKTDVSVPDDLSIVAMCNFPVTGERLLPIKRIGFNTPDLLRLATERLVNKLCGEASSKCTILEPIDEAS